MSARAGSLFRGFSEFRASSERLSGVRLQGRARLGLRGPLAAAATGTLIALLTSVLECAHAKSAEPTSDGLL